MTIYKYPLYISDRNEIEMPSDAKILCVQMQHGVLYIWALVDEVHSLTRFRYIRIFGTGHPIDDPNKLRYIGTVNDGRFVWHVFEEE